MNMLNKVLVSFCIVLSAGAGLPGCGGGSLGTGHRPRTVAFQGSLTQENGVALGRAVSVTARSSVATVSTTVDSTTGEFELDLVVAEDDVVSYDFRSVNGPVSEQIDSTVSIGMLPSDATTAAVTFVVEENNDVSLVDIDTNSESEDTDAESEATSTAGEATSTAGEATNTEDETINTIKVSSGNEVAATCTELDCEGTCVDSDDDGAADLCEVDEPAPCEDQDRDGLCDEVDLCLTTPSTNNSDADGDGIGDVCDDCQDIDNSGFCDDNEPCVDSDDDSICDEADLCPNVSSTNNEDIDADGIGDICDSCQDINGDGYCAGEEPCDDGDEDGICDEADLCPDSASADNNDADADGIGDVCDDCQDMDQDGFCNDVDLCPYIPSLKNDDVDSDGVGDACDNCILHFNPDQIDTNGDGYGNRCDADFVKTDRDESDIVGFADFGEFGSFTSFSCGDTNYNQEFDLNVDCTVDMDDFDILYELFNKPPGPSAYVN